MLRALHHFFQDLRWSTYQKLQGELHDLRYLFWEATRQCNLSCRHCGSDCGRDESIPGLPADEVLGCLRSIARAYDARKIMLVVTGGEPLVRPDLLEVMDQARSLGFVLGMVTNGLALDEDWADRLTEVGLKSVVVSLDGPQDCHEWLRRNRHSWENACRAIVALGAAGVPLVEAITCVTPRSLDRLAETYDIVQELSATHWRVFNIFPAGRAKGDAELLLDAGGIARLVPEMARLRAKGQAEGLEVNLSEEGFLGWDWESQVRGTPYFCRAGINIAGLLADGSVAACPNLAPSMSQGNIRTDDFVEVWETRYQKFRDRSWTRQGECADCDQWKVCQGNSLHLWDEERGAPCWCHYKILHP